MYFSMKAADWCEVMAGQNTHIRPAVSDDIEQVLDIERACYDHPWKAAQFFQELENPASSLDICLIDGRIAGYHCYWFVAGEMQILNLATSVTMRRSGVAGRLLEHAFATASSELTAVWLEVRAGNHAAISLYSRCGFRDIGLRRAYYRDGEDAVIMVKEFR